MATQEEEKGKVCKGYCFFHIYKADILFNSKLNFSSVYHMYRIQRWKTENCCWRQEKSGAKTRLRRNGLAIVNENWEDNDDKKCST